MPGLFSEFKSGTSVISSSSILSWRIPQDTGEPINIGVVKRPLYIQSFFRWYFKEDWLGRLLWHLIVPTRQEKVMVGKTVLRWNRASRGEMGSEGEVRASLPMEWINASLSVKALEGTWTLPISKCYPGFSTHWPADHQQFSIWEQSFSIILRRIVGGGEWTLCNMKSNFLKLITVFYIIWVSGSSLLWHFVIT